MGNLNVPQLAENQSAPEVTVNDATAALDAALTEAFSADLTSGNVSLSNADYRGAIRFRAINASTARNLTLPAIKRTVFLESDSANTGVVTVVVGSTSIATQAGHLYLVFTDGTTNGLSIYDLGTTALPNDLHVFVPGAMSNAQLCYRLKATRPFKLPASLTGSYITAVTAATASTTVTLKKNGASIGTAVWAISGTTATITFASAVSFVAGDVFTIEGPATADATLADISFDILGSR